MDTRRDLANAVNHALERAGWGQMAGDAITARVGDGARNLMENCLAAAAAAKGSPVPEGCLEGILEDFLRHYGDHCLDESRAYPGVEAALDRLGGYRKAVLTNKPHEPARKILAGLGLAGHFETVVGGDGSLGRKPDPAGLRHIMAAAGAGPGETAVIGDGVQDLRAAQAAGAAFIAFLGGMAPREELLREIPANSIEAMEALPEAVDRLGRMAR